MMTILPTQTAMAAGTIQVSEDGITYGATYPGVLFDGIANTVPGDTQTEVFYLRNDGPDAGYLRITLNDVTGDPAFVDRLSVSTSPTGMLGPPVELTKANPCWVLNEGILLAAGEVLAVTTVLSFDPAAGNTTQKSLANFNIRINLSDTVAELPPTDCGGSDGTDIPGTDIPGTDIPGTGPQQGGLAPSGAEVPVMLISVTAFITGVGVFLVVAARRRNRRDDGEETGE